MSGIALYDAVEVDVVEEVSESKKAFDTSSLSSLDSSKAFSKSWKEYNSTFLIWTVDEAKVQNT